MNTEEYIEEMNEIFRSYSYRDLDKAKKKDYRTWLLATMQHPERFQHVIHKVKYKLGILRTQMEEEE